MAEQTRSLIEAIQAEAHPLTSVTGNFDPLIELIGDARFVLLGEASHGTHEFYAARAHITRRLIEEKGFGAVAVEADWPDAYRVNRFVRGRGSDRSPTEALSSFERFPLWMWRNDDVVEFVDWLRPYNEDASTAEKQAGFYGIDLYSLYSSIQSVLAYLDRIDPEAARRARYRYSCFDHFGEDSQAYGYAASFNLTESCEEEVLNQLAELQRNATQYEKDEGGAAHDEYFFAEQNARLVKNAEAYYRSMFRGRQSSWNLRDQHMVQTLQELDEHLSSQKEGPAKIVVWAHNSHLGDARATEMGTRGELNVGQLVRERYGDQARLVGFTTHTGTVTAASNWDEPPQRKQVRPSLPESYERLFHLSGIGDFVLLLKGSGDAAQALDSQRLERAIGVIYRPETERISHYFYASLPGQFDAVIHFDETTAVRPLERQAATVEEEVPETFPSGL